METKSNPFIFKNDNYQKMSRNLDQLADNHPSKLNNML